jgi:hypothetical protein
MMSLVEVFREISKIVSSPLGISIFYNLVWTEHLTLVSKPLWKPKRRRMTISGMMTFSAQRQPPLRYPKDERDGVAQSFGYY